MLKTQVSQDILQAMRDKDKLKKETLKIVKGNIENLEIEKQRELNQSEEIQVIQKEVKQAKESLADSVKYDRSDLIEKNESKLEILYKYLPKQLTESEVKEICVNAGVVSGMNMGEAMKLAMPNLKGKTENALISKTVKDLIK